jgi:hypothetical protein
MDKAGIFSASDLGDIFDKSAAIWVSFCERADSDLLNKPICKSEGDDRLTL